MCILDLSKTLMFDFQYTYIKPKYGDKVKLLYTDTDSLMYEIETEDFYRDISDDVEARFDTSDFDKDHPSGIPTGKNKKQEAQLMLTTGSTRLAVNRGQQTWYHSTCYIYM